MRIVLLAGWILTLVSGALGQSPALGKDEKQGEVRKVMYAYAACVVRLHHKDASEAVLAMTDNQMINTRMSQLKDAGCLTSAAGGKSVKMHFPGDIYRYALADALVNADLAHDATTSFADRLPLGQPAAVTTERQVALLFKAKGRDERKEVKDYIDARNTSAWLGPFGECVVRAEPVAARYWLLTPPETAEEISRIRALQAAFEGCLKDGTVHFDRVTMRGIVAMSYYRLSMGTRIPGAGSAH